MDEAPNIEQNLNINENIDSKTKEIITKKIDDN